ncbi:hypothetical protein [Micromonospora psammae]|uniref:hypothetical protein n=1 Tax=Micromonospora sp. CPCC 205556 TaxID=3122398 RepID=UPI002FEFABB2
MAWFSRRSRTADPTPTKLDREATRDDLAALEHFVTSRQGVEFYLEPETTATDTTVVAIAHDGEWIRRRTGSPQVAGKLARRHAVPLYEAMKTGYPQRMREWNRAHPERRLR